MDEKKIKISLTLNIIIVILTLFASIIMFTGIKFMHGYEPVLESTSFGVLRFFTVQSNLFMGIIALLFAINEINILKKKITSISKKLYLMKLMSTTAVGLTFFVVFAYLGHISQGGILSLLMNSNLFFHLLIPVMSIICFIFFEKNDKLRFKDTFYGLIPTLVYAVYYLTNILLHTENGKVLPIYDWYWFVQNGVWTMIIVGPLILVITYLISLSLWKFNKMNK